MEKRQFYNKNQFIMDDDKKIVFQSYNSIIAVIDKKTGALFFGNDWNYSNTTRKHLYLFLSDYKYEIGADLYAMIFRRGFDDSKNKRQFLQNLIDQKIIKLKEF
jgi:hypothetical protein